VTAEFGAAAAAAVMCASVAGWLWPATPAARMLRHRLGPRPDRRWRIGRASAVPIVIPSVVIVFGFAVGWRFGGVGGIGVAAAFCIGWRWRRRRGGRTAGEAARRREVLTGCQSLASLLRSGRAPVAAFVAVGTDWPDTFGAAAAAARFDGDIGPALRKAGRAPGAEGLAALAAGWTVSTETGAGLADVVDGVVRTLRDWEFVRRETAAQLASARATARLLGALPLLPHALGVGLGADPARFLFRTPSGLGCLAVGGVLMLLGLLWVDRLSTAPELLS
jgi:tight adherence protein B